MLRAREKITSLFGISDSGHLWPIFIHEILERARYSCGYAQSDQPNLTQIRAPILLSYFFASPYDPGRFHRICIIHGHGWLVYTCLMNPARKNPAGPIQIRATAPEHGVKCPRRFYYILQNAFHILLLLQWILSSPIISSEAYSTIYSNFG